MDRPRSGRSRFRKPVDVRDVGKEHGVHFVGDRCHQVLAWRLRGDEARKEEPLAPAIAAVRLLEGEALAALRAEFAKAPDPQVHVEGPVSLRGGVLRDFEFTRLVFGIACSPSLAMHAVATLAENKSSSS